MESNNERKLEGWVDGRLAALDGGRVAAGHDSRPRAVAAAGGGASRKQRRPEVDTGCGCGHRRRGWRDDAARSASAGAGTA